MSAQDRDFIAAVTSAADAEAGALLRAPGVAELHSAPLGPHRAAMRRVKLLVAVHIAPGSRYTGDRVALSLALEYAAALERMQAATGLFSGGDNVESPPDSGFTINDLGDTVELLRRVPAPRSHDLQQLERRLRAIATAATPAMVAGGVHTPNHRWELAAALARLHRLDGAASSRTRALQWLAEGIDIDADGQYSERSANYATHVSNPSLLAIGDIFGRKDLHDIVERNLESNLGLIHSDATVETVHSRRQDQKDLRFPLGASALHYRRFAISEDRGDFAWAAELAMTGAIMEPQTALADLLLDPRLGERMPTAVPPPVERRQTWSGSALVRDDSAKRSILVYAGSDYSDMGRIRSGLANNPTFLRLFAGGLILDSVRLSRDFFGLGPFRASSMVSEGEALVLEEVVEGHYYLPMATERQQQDGRYEVVDEGRFAAAMSFDQRETTAVSLATRVTVTPLSDGVELDISVDGPATSWALELAFRDGGTFEGGSLDGGTFAGDGEDLSSNGVLLLRDGFARYRVGDRALVFGPGTGVDAAIRYRAGEDYEYLGGTDALSGPRAYIAGRGPGAHRLTIRATG